jgi:hypothetical protein
LLDNLPALSQIPTLYRAEFEDDYEQAIGLYLEGRGMSSLLIQLQHLHSIIEEKPQIKPFICGS